MDMQRTLYLTNAAFNLVTRECGKRRKEVVSSGVDVGLAPCEEESCWKPALSLASYVLSPLPMCNLEVSMIFAVQALIGLLLGTNEIISGKPLCNHTTFVTNRYFY